MDKANFSCLVFGEILYDRFPDRTCLGGAALNFAWNLRQLGFPVAMISAVGRDDLGQQARDFLTRADIDQQWVAARDEPTGTVDVFLQDGQPSYTIRSGVAWDYIETMPPLDQPPDLIYYGTAAQRSPANRPGLEHLLAANPRHRFFDVNLRQDAYAEETVLFGLEAATIVKLNDDEWEQVRKSRQSPTPPISSPASSWIAWRSPSVQRAPSSTFPRLPSKSASSRCPSSTRSAPATPLAESSPPAPCSTSTSSKSSAWPAPPGPPPSSTPVPTWNCPRQ